MIKNQSLEAQEQAENTLLGRMPDKILFEQGEFILSSVFCYFFAGLAFASGKKVQQCKKVKNVYQEQPIAE